MQQTNKQQLRREARQQRRKQLVDIRIQRATEQAARRVERQRTVPVQPHQPVPQERALPKVQPPRRRPANREPRAATNSIPRRALTPPPYSERTETFVCMATGPSLTQEQVDYLKDKPVKLMAINDSYKMNLDADYHYACDTRWWNLHGKEVKDTYKGQSWTQCHKSAELFNIELISGVHKSGLGRDIIHFGSNSGYQAINLAWLLGAKRIILIGYDMQKTGGKAHWFGEHPPSIKTNTNYTSFVPKFTSLAKDLENEKIEVINCSIDTALQCFKRANLEDVL